VSDPIAPSRDVADGPVIISCAACGAENAADNAFCGVCGARVEDAVVDTLRGKVIDDRFRIKRLLGSGGMGAIYLAEHVGIGKRVAIKLLRADLRSHPHLVKRFRREAMAVSRLTDAHTITVFDFGVWDGVVYLVMEYLIGDDLSKALAGGSRLSPRRALLVAHQICSSLAEAHAVGVIHRDLKPENVFITRTTSGDELVKVLDFGLAKILQPDGAEALLQTADGALMGTPYYMAPEQVRGEAVDARTDLYALGGLMFRMLTGQVPYTGKSPLQVMEAHVSGPLRRFAEVDPTLDVPPAVEALVRRLMARRPDDRPDNALHVDQDVVALLDQIPPDRSEPPRPRSESPAAIEDRTGTAPERPSVLDTRPDAVFDDVPPDDEGPTVDVATPAERPRDRAGLTFDDDPSDGPITLGDPDPSSRSWVIGDSAPPTEPGAEPRRRRSSSGRWSWIALVLLLGVGAGAGGYGWYLQKKAPQTVEVEPNDEARDATPIAEGVAVEGVIGPSDAAAGDRDVYVIDVPPDRRAARARVSGVDGLDLILEGFAYDGSTVFTADDRGEGRAERAVLEVAGDRLLVAVRAQVSPGQSAPTAEATPYRLRVTFDSEVRPLRRPGRDREEAADARSDAAASDAGD